MRRAVKRVVVALLLALSAGRAASQQPSIVVELNGNTPSYTEWLRSGRSGQIDALRSLLGEHTTAPYILSSTLQCVEQAIERSSSAKTRLESTIERLQRYAVITLHGPRNAALLASKLRQNSLVLQAQVLPEQRIVGQPNDPELQRQYYLPRIDVFRAWELLPPSASALVAIIDTGIDTAHVDLQGSVWKNSAEMGLDDSGLDKRTNRKDDDGNGFVDDWFGWDFVGRNGSMQDNIPLPGNSHGTHVGGIVAAQVNNAIGMAGVARQVRVMAVKVGRDDPNSESVARSADGILYASAMGADVINCSFGSSSPTFADVDVIQTATKLGSLVVGAAGNDASDQAFYPAAYAEAVSVAATDLSDRLAPFSNVHSTVDVCAPGVGIFSTIPGNSYASYNGTSMAAPIVSAVAAMITQCFPSYTPSQVRAALVSSCEDIDTLNSAYVGKFGMGRINAYRACSGLATRWCVVTRHLISDVDADGIFRNGDALDLTITLRNVLSDLANARVVLQSLDSSVEMIDSVISFGALAAQQELTLPSPLRFRLKQSLSDNQRIDLRVRVFDDGGVVGSDVISTVANPTYATISVNDIATTVNSSGNIGYNDYSANEQGVGFRYKESPSLLFEGALMIGTAPTLLPNVARGEETNVRDNSFKSSRAASLRTDSVVSGARVATAFTDDRSTDGLGLTVMKNVYARDEDSLKNSILVVLTVTNASDRSIDNIYAAYFFDFDIGANGANNVCSWDSELGAFMHRNVVESALPRVAMTMISPLPLNGFAVDNDGAIDCPSIYDDFTRAEKWFMMSQGLRRRTSTPTDASTVIGAGPFSLSPGSSQQIAWIIAAGMSRSDLLKGLTSMRNAATDQGVEVQPYVPIPLVDGIKHVAGSPLLSSGEAEIVYSLTLPSNVVLDLIDITGRQVAVLHTESDVISGDHSVTITLPDVAQGAYFVRLTTARSSRLFPIGIVR